MLGRPPRMCLYQPCGNGSLHYLHYKLTLVLQYDTIILIFQQ